MKIIFILFTFLLTGCYIYAQAGFNNSKITECDGKYGLADSTGKTLLPAKYENITELVPGLVVVKMNGKYALANYELGIQLTPAVYDYITDETSGLLLVEIHDLEGLIDYTGKEIIRVRYDKVESTGNDKIIVQKKKKKGLFDLQGKQLTRIKYNDITIYRDGCFRIEKDNRYGLIGPNGTVLIPAKYDHNIRIHNNYSDRIVFSGQRNGKYYLYNESGKRINHEWYSDVRRYSGFNYLIVEKQGKEYTKSGLIHISGKTIVPVRYANIGHEFNAGQVSTQLHDPHKYGEIHYYNKDGKRIFRDSPKHTIVYDSIRSDKHSSCTLAYKDNRVSLLNSDGKVIEDGLKAIFPVYTNLYQVIDRYNCMYFIDEHGDKKIDYQSPIRFNGQDTFDPLPDMLILAKNEEWRSAACWVRCRRITDNKEKEELQKEWADNPLPLFNTIDRYGLDELHYTRYSQPDIRFDYKFEIHEIPDEYQDLQFTNGTQDFYLWGTQFPGYWIIAQKNGKYGIIDIRDITTPVLPFVYDSIKMLKHNTPTLLLEQKGLKCYYPISSKPRYETLNPFIHHFARFQLPDKRIGWLSWDGKEYLD
ncbi:MAG: WG repeat-containing protein [Tannerella sp.]|jgi:hypothetical protein|nr:WG repeat-containing protein [Tannerella sp.]